MLEKSLNIFCNNLKAKAFTLLDGKQDWLWTVSQFLSGNIHESPINKRGSGGGHFMIERHNALAYNNVGVHMKSQISAEDKCVHFGRKLITNNIFTTSDKLGYKKEGDQNLIHQPLAPWGLKAAALSVAPQCPRKKGLCLCMTGRIDVWQRQVYWLSAAIKISWKRKKLSNKFANVCLIKISTFYR